MADVVVTIPKRFGLQPWIEEGDPAGSVWGGSFWSFTVGGSKPEIRASERVYVIYNGRLRGYAPLVRLEWAGHGGALIRGGGAVAVTIDETIVGFR